MGYATFDGYNSFSEYYDTLMQNVGYPDRARYIIDVFTRLDHDMGLSLDLACGTGSLTVELKKLGIDIYGVDASYDMLSYARQKAVENDLDILFLCQKMQSLDLYGTIDTCICTLDSINHLTRLEDVQKTFDKVSLFMNKGGYFLFDVNSVYKHKEVLADNTFVYDTEDVFCVWQNSLKENNIVNIELDFFEREGDVYYRMSEEFSERAYTDEELSKMLKKAGLEVVRRFGDMTFESPKKDEQRIIYIARKK
ncbi:MAG: class I SAM-dependent methyltransferase [Ruminococcaceae bacterium]|nr:class I SAM-dependent methyltransferase [Oscillospiraceae bacterium]